MLPAKDGDKHLIFIHKHFLNVQSTKVGDMEGKKMNLIPTLSKCDSCYVTVILSISLYTY